MCRCRLKYCVCVCVQVVVVCVKEVCAEVVCGSVPGVGDLDSIVLRTKLLSSLTDELVSELPAPISRSGLSSLVSYNMVDQCVPVR